MVIKVKCRFCFRYSFKCGAGNVWLMFNEELKRCNLRLEKGTRGVPDDGYYYLFHKKEQVGRFKSYKKAQKEFEKIELQYPPPKKDKSKVGPKEILKNQWRTVSNKSLYWYGEKDE